MVTIPHQHTLYKEDGVTIDQLFLNDTSSMDGMIHDIRAKAALHKDHDNKELMIEPIGNDSHQVESLLFAKQHTIL